MHSRIMDTRTLSSISKQFKANANINVYYLIQVVFVAAIAASIKASGDKHV